MLSFLRRSGDHLSMKTEDKNVGSVTGEGNKGEHVIENS